MQPSDCQNSVGTNDPHAMHCSMPANWITSPPWRLPACTSKPAAMKLSTAARSVSASTGTAILPVLRRVVLDFATVCRLPMFARSPAPLPVPPLAVGRLWPKPFDAPSCTIASTGNWCQRLQCIRRHILDCQRCTIASTGNWLRVCRRALAGCQYWHHVRYRCCVGCVDFPRRVDDGEGGVAGKGSAVSSPPVPVLAPLAFMPRTSCCA